MRFAKSALLSLLIGVAAPLLESSSTATIEHIDRPFLVAGYLVRTNNAAEAGGEGKIGPLWQRFAGENLATRIPHRTDSNLTVVYSNYASDAAGDYDYLLGARVDSVEHLPPGMTSRTVQPGDYAVIFTEIGSMPSVLEAAWRRIWKMSSTETGGRRRFVTDYEIYDQRSADPAHAQVEIRLGVDRRN